MQLQLTHLPSNSFTDDMAFCFKTGVITKSLSQSGPVYVCVCQGGRGRNRHQWANSFSQWGSSDRINVLQFLCSDPRFNNNFIQSSDFLELSNANTVYMDLTQFLDRMDISSSIRFWLYPNQLCCHCQSWISIGLNQSKFQDFFYAFDWVDEFTLFSQPSVNYFPPTDWIYQTFCLKSMWLNNYVSDKWIWMQIPCFTPWNNGTTWCYIM